MPVCPQCDNRQFTNKEALLQHMRSSSAWHPFCTQCDRRFVSETAYEAHMVAKHPPTFDCTVCDRTFHAPFALEDHYRGSNAHPNCTKCGRGFRDVSACDEHRRTAHPKSACAPCGGKIVYDDEVAQHFWDSPNHPKCHPCKIGCKDDASYVEHMSTVHPEQHCAVCTANFDTSEALQAHFWVSPAHPKCDPCSIGLASNEARDLHMETAHTPTPTVTAVAAAVIGDPPELIGNGSSSNPVDSSVVNNAESAPISAARDTTFELPRAPSLPPPIQKTEPLASPTNYVYHTGFTPLSPRNPMQNLIVGERRINSPDLRLELGFSSPILDAKPPFSPTSLPRPGGKFEEIWRTTENVQVPTTWVNHFSAARSVVEPYNAIRLGYLAQPGGSPSSTSSIASSSPWFSDSGRLPLRPQEKLSNISPPRLTPSHMIPSPPRLVSSPPRMAASPPRLVSPPRDRLSSPPRSEFHPRLYPGSVRAASLRQSLIPLSDSGLGNESTTGQRGFMNGSGAASVSGGTTYSYAQSRSSQSPPQTYSFHSSYTPSHYGGSVTGRSRGPPSDVVNWEELMGPAPASPETVFSSATSTRNDSWGTLFSETLSSPKTEVPSPPWSVSGLSPNQGKLGTGSQGQNRLIQNEQQNMASSPSLATLSSPASGSSALGHSPGGSAQYEADTRPTTASSTPSHTPLSDLVYTITPSSKCPSPHHQSPHRSPDSDIDLDLSFTLNSPAGLRSLPSMSPIPETPLDITEYDIPEARQPLPDSPAEGMSPVTVVVELPWSVEEMPDLAGKGSREPVAAIDIQVHQYSTSPRSTSSAQSFITSPQEPTEAEGRISPVPSPIPSPGRSPQMRHTGVLDLDTDAATAAAPFLSDDMDVTMSTPVDNIEGQSFTLTATNSTPITPIAYGGVEPEEELKADAKVDSSPKPNPNPLHCRVCLVDSCDDITASMCGHIFCNRCITDAVIKTSRCPTVLWE